MRQKKANWKIKLILKNTIKDKTKSSEESILLVEKMKKSLSYTFFFTLRINKITLRFRNLFPHLVSPTCSIYIKCETIYLYICHKINGQKFHHSIPFSSIIYARTSSSNLFLHTINIINWVLGENCSIYQAKKKKKEQFFFFIFLFNE